MGLSADETGALVDEQAATNIATHATAKTLPIGDSSPGRAPQIGVWAERARRSHCSARGPCGCGNGERAVAKTFAGHQSQTRTTLVIESLDIIARGADT